MPLTWYAKGNNFLYEKALTTSLTLHSERCSDYIVVSPLAIMLNLLIFLLPIQFIRKKFGDPESDWDEWRVELKKSRFEKAIEFDKNIHKK